MLKKVKYENKKEYYGTNGFGIKKIKETPVKREILTLPKGNADAK